MKLYETIAKYEKHMKADYKPDNTIRIHLSALKRFAEWFKNGDIDSVTSGTVLDYKEHLLSKGAGGKSINTYMSIFRSFFSLMYQYDYIDKDLSKYFTNYKPKIASLEKMQGIRQREYSDKDVQKIKKFITKEQQREIYKVASKRKSCIRDKLLMQTMITCGLRCSEARTLQVKNIDIENKTLRIVGKGYKERMVPLLNSKHIKALMEYIENLDTDDYLFKAVGSTVNKPMTSQALHIIFNEIMTSAGIPVGRGQDGVASHDFRGTYITAMLDAGASISDVAEAVGHSNWLTTKMYYRPNDSEDKRLRLEKLMRESELV